MLISKKMVSNVKMKKIKIKNIYCFGVSLSPLSFLLFPTLGPVVVPYLVVTI